MNIFFNTDTMQKTVNSRTVSTGQKGAQKALTTALRYVNEETHCNKTKH